MTVHRLTISAERDWAHWAECADAAWRNESRATVPPCFGDEPTTPPVAAGWPRRHVKGPQETRTCDVCGSEFTCAVWMNKLTCRWECSELRHLNAQAARIRARRAAERGRRE